MVITAPWAPKKLPKHSSNIITKHLTPMSMVWLDYMWVFFPSCMIIPTDGFVLVVACPRAPNYVRHNCRLELGRIYTLSSLVSDAYAMNLMIAYASIFIPLALTFNHNLLFLPSHYIIIMLSEWSFNAHIRRTTSARVAKYHRKAQKRWRGQAHCQNYRYSTFLESQCHCHFRYGGHSNWRGQSASFLWILSPCWNGAWPILCSQWCFPIELWTVEKIIT